MRKRLLSTLHILYRVTLAYVLERPRACRCKHQLRKGEDAAKRALAMQMHAESHGMSKGQSQVTPSRILALETTNLDLEATNRDLRVKLDTCASMNRLHLLKCCHWQCQEAQHRAWHWV